MPEFAMQRSRVIPVSAEAIYPLMIDFHKWTQWSPWESLDTDLERTYTGAESGVGARYGWAGKRWWHIDRRGRTSCKSTLLELHETDEDAQLTQFTLEPVEGTKVTWRMSGTQVDRALLLQVVQHREGHRGRLRERAGQPKPPQLDHGQVSPRRSDLQSRVVVGLTLARGAHLGTHEVVVRRTLHRPEDADRCAVQDAAIGETRQRKRGGRVVAVGIVHEQRGLVGDVSDDLDTAGL